MSRRRYVSTTISTDTAVNRLALNCGDFAALLYTWMIPHAGDDCSLPSDPEELLFIICPGRRDKTAEDIGTALQSMIRLGLIELCDDARFVRFPPESFYKHQSYIKPDRQNAKQGAQNSANPRKSAQNATSVSSSVSSSDSISTCGTSDVRAADADAPPERPKRLKTHSPELAAVSAAFTEAGLRDPLTNETARRHATEILKLGLSPPEVAACVRDIRGGEWGDDWLRQNCCLRTLRERDRILNWHEWVEAGRPQQVGRERGNGAYSQRNHI